jgi:hypothetical protein
MSTAGYPASNVALESITRNWRATGAGQHRVTLTFSAAGPIAAILLEDVNFTSCAVAKSPDGSSVSSVGTLTTFADKWVNRRRGLLEINDASTKAVKLSISFRHSARWPRILAHRRRPSVQLGRSDAEAMPDYGARVNAIFPKVSADIQQQAGGAGDHRPGHPRGNAFVGSAPRART